MEDKSIIEIIWDEEVIKEQPFLGWFATKLRVGLTKYFPKLAFWISSKRKGHCDPDCDDCCHGCPILKNKSCTKYERRPLACGTAPFPTDLWFNPRFKRCTFYYMGEEID